MATTSLPPSPYPTAPPQPYRFGQRTTCAPSTSSHSSTTSPPSMDTPSLPPGSPSPADGTLPPGRPP
eukprot:12829511-Heterocapsa_arctica.AAC.1